MIKSLSMNVDGYVKMITVPFSKLIKKAQDQYRRISTDNFTEVLAMSVKKNIESITMQMSYESVKWTKNSIPKVYKKAAGMAETATKEAGYKKEINVNHNGNITKMQEDALVYLNVAISSVREFTDRYIDAVRDSLVAMNDIPASVEEFDFRTAVSGIIADTVKKKQSVNFAKNQIMQLLTAKVSGASFVFINGRTYDIRYYTDLVARTELARTYHQAHLATFKEFGDDLVRFDEHNDACPVCAQFEGNIYSLSGESKEYEALPDGADIPVHPNCSHTLVPVPVLAGGGIYG